jgi:hypothetical protein
MPEGCYCDDLYSSLHATETLPIELRGTTNFTCADTYNADTSNWDFYCVGTGS